MPRLIMPTDEFRRILRRRRETGTGRKDEVWNGVYVMSPDPNNEHHKLVGSLVIALFHAVGEGEDVVILPGGNVTDRADNWTKNYRCPDVLVFLPDNPAEDRGTHYLGGPDFAVEILSPQDRARKKFDFYAKVGVRELLLIDRAPWRLELYRLRDGAYEPARVSDEARPAAVESAVLSVSFRLRPEAPRPRIEVTRPADGRVWLV
jgi:Uma2 family endonuclease